MPAPSTIQTEATPFVRGAFGERLMHRFIKRCIMRESTKLNVLQTGVAALYTCGATKSLCGPL